MSFNQNDFGVNVSSELPTQRTAFIKIWVTAIALIYLALGALSVSTVAGEKRAADRNHALRMSVNDVESGKTRSDALPANADFTNVSVGIYLDGIDGFSIKDSSWTANFYVWFRWKGNQSLEPGESLHLVDAKIEKKERVDNYTAEDGTHYQAFKMVARITKFFNTTRVPLEDHMLNIYLEDAVHDVAKLRYIVDSAANFSSRVRVPSYTITGFSHVVKPHTYRTNYGDPRMQEGKGATFSQYVFALTLKRSDMGIFFKFFIGLFAGVLLTMGSFFIRPSDIGPRLGLPSAAYFGAVANAYLVNSLLPSSGQFGLADYVTFIGLFTIFF